MGKLVRYTLMGCDELLVALVEVSRILMGQTFGAMGKEADGRESYPSFSQR
jgi:hypothetical protein